MSGIDDAHPNVVDATQSTLPSATSEDTNMAKVYSIQEEKKESDSVSTGLYGSVIKGSSSIDDPITFSEEMRSSNKPKKLEDKNAESKPPQRKPRRKTRRKRGDSLERQISQLILGTESSGAAQAQFGAAEGSEPVNKDSPPVDFILQDLVNLDEGRSERSIQSGRGLTHEQQPVEPQPKVPSNLNPGAVLAPGLLPHKAESSQEYDDPSLEIDFSDGEDERGDEHPNIDRGLGDKRRAAIPASSVEEDNGQKRGMECETVKFENVSRKEVDLEQMLPSGPNRSLSPAMSSPSPIPSITPPTEWAVEKEPPTDESMNFKEAVPKKRVTFPHENWMSKSKVDPTRRTHSQDSTPAKGNKAEKVTFKTDFDDWTPFEPMDFIPNMDMRFSDTLVDPIEFEESSSIDENGFLVTPPQLLANIPKSKHTTQSKRSLAVQPEYRRGQPPSALDGKRASEVQTFGWFHPNSPDSVLEYPKKSHTNSRADPPGNEDLQLPENETIRLAI